MYLFNKKNKILEFLFHFACTGTLSLVYVPYIITFLFKINNHMEDKHQSFSMVGQVTMYRYTFYPHRLLHVAIRLTFDSL